MGEMPFTDKLVFGWLEGFGAWSLDSATPCQSLLTMPTQVACRGYSQSDVEAIIIEALRRLRWGR